MIHLDNSSYPAQPSAWLIAVGLGVLLWLSPGGLTGEETQEVTLYTPSGSQERTLSAPTVVDVGLPVPVAAPASKVTGTGTGTRLTGVGVVVSEGAGGQAAASYAKDPVTALAADASGNVWVGTRAGLSRFDGGGWRTFTAADGLASDHIYSLAVDGQGRVWAGSLNGVTRFDGQRWTRHEKIWGLEIATAPNGDVWSLGLVGGEYLLMRFDGQVWWGYDHADIGIDVEDANFDDVRFIRIVVDGTGTLWAIAQFNDVIDLTMERFWTSLFTFDGTRWTSYQVDTGLVLPDSQGRAWVASIGLYVKDGSTWKHYGETEAGDTVRWSVSGMAEDRAGRLWIAGADYFGVLEGTTWTGFSYSQFHDTGRLAMDSRGDLWIASYDGLYRLARDDQPTAVDSTAPSGEPRSFHLDQNYPNPFNHETRIGFRFRQRAELALRVLNVRGQTVATLVSGTRPAGSYETVWDGRDDQGQAVASGLYIYRLHVGDRRATGKMMLVQ